MRTLVKKLAARIFYAVDYRLSKYLIRERPIGRFNKFDPDISGRLSKYPRNGQRAANSIIASGQFEKAFQLNAELALSRKNRFGDRKWRERMIVAGLMAAVDGEHERAAEWLSEGMLRFDDKVPARGRTYGFPYEFIDWINENKEIIKHKDGWRKLLREAEGENRDTLYAHICFILLALGFRDPVKSFVTYLVSPKVRYLRRAIELRLIPISSRPDANRYFDIADADVRDQPGLIMSHMVHQTFENNSEERGKRKPFDQTVLGILGSDAKYNHIKNENFLLVCDALHLLGNCLSKQVPDLLQEVLISNEEFLRTLEQREGPKRVYVGGYGWTGSSAIFDGLLGYPEVGIMPGVGEDAIYLNEGADSEPMIHQGPAGVQAMLTEVDRYKSLRELFWRKFLRIHVLNAPFESYFEYKSTHAAANVRRKLGDDPYYLIILKFLHDYARLDHHPDRVWGGKDVIRRFEANLVNALFPSDETVVLFNNSVNTNKVGVLAELDGRTSYIAVNRNVHDQFADQKRFNMFLDVSAKQFANSKLEKIKKFSQQTKGFEKKRIEVIDVFFEDYVTDINVRKSLAEKLIGYYSDEHERRFLQVEKSIKNVNMHSDYLDRSEAHALSLVKNENKTWAL